MIMSESKLRDLLPPKVKLMSNQMWDLCGHDICILATSLQASLNSLRLKHIICIEHLAKYRVEKSLSGVFFEHLKNYTVCMYSNVCHLHKIASDASVSKL